jgi:hypothetical protein
MSTTRFLQIQYLNLTKVNFMEVTDNFYLLDFVRKDWIPVLHAIIQWIPNWKMQSRDQIQNSK